MSEQLRTARTAELEWLLDADGAPIGLRDAQGKQWNAAQGLSQAQLTAALQGGRAVSPYTVFCIPTLQTIGSGSARDVSGNGHDFVRGTGLADDGSGVWSDTSRELNALAKIPDGSGAGRYLYMPSLTTVWDLSEWFIFSMLLKCTVAPQTRNIISCANAGSHAGWYLKANAAGKLFVVIINGAFAVGGNIASTPVLTTNGVTNHITVAVDPTGKDIFLYVNGLLVNQWLNSWSGSGASTLFLATANSGITAAGTTENTYGMLCGAFQYYKGVGTLPAHHAAIARRLAAAPFSPLGYFDI